MEPRTARTIISELNHPIAGGQYDTLRLEALLQANAATLRIASMYPTRSDEIEARTMGHPLTHVQAISWLGSMLGTIPPAALFVLFLLSKGPGRLEPLVVILMIFANIVTAITGFFTGKFVGTIVKNSEKLTFSKRLLVLAGVGAMWGSVSGAAGGVFLYIIGAVFGGIIGSLVGVIALPFFSIPYFILRKGGMIDRRHFLPISVGISVAIGSFIIGFYFR